MRPRGLAVNGRMIEVLDLRTVHDEALLRQFHRQLYLPAFPRAQRERASTWRELLWGGDARVELHCVLAGFDLRNAKRRELFGGHLFEFYPAVRCGLLTYLVVARHHRGQGLGSFLLRLGLEALHRSSGQRRRVRAVFAEVEDPRTIARASRLTNPWRRLDFFCREGARMLDIPYVQPEVSPGAGRPRNLLLLAVEPPYASRLPSRVVREFLREYYLTLGVAAPSRDRDYIRMLRCLRRDPVRAYDSASLLQHPHA